MLTERQLGRRWTFSANLTTLWTDLPFEERIGAAARAGFTTVECAYPYASDPQRLRGLADAAGVRWCMINLPAGEASRGERGFACRPEAEKAFWESVERGRSYAHALGAAKVTCMVGNRGVGEDSQHLWQTAVVRLRAAANYLAEVGIGLQVEALNPIDFPDFCLTRPGEALALIEAVGSANLQLQFDAYHALMTEPDVLAALRASREHIGHVHVADLPARSAPGHGPLPTTELLSLLDAFNYQGAVGLEYRAASPRAEDFAWLTPWRGPSNTPN